MQEHSPSMHGPQVPSEFKTLERMQMTSIITIMTQTRSRNSFFRRLWNQEPNCPTQAQRTNLTAHENQLKTAEQLPLKFSIMPFYLAFLIDLSIARQFSDGTGAPVTSQEEI